MQWYILPSGTTVNLSRCDSLRVRDESSPLGLRVPFWSVSAARRVGMFDMPVILALFAVREDAQVHLAWIQDKIAAGAMVVRCGDSRVAGKDQWASVDFGGKDL